MEAPGVSGRLDSEERPGCRVVSVRGLGGPLTKQVWHSLSLWNVLLTCAAARELYYAESKETNLHVKVRNSCG